jgi:hypothetical protein
VGGNEEGEEEAKALSSTGDEGGKEKEVSTFDKEDLGGGGREGV